MTITSDFVVRRFDVNFKFFIIMALVDCTVTPSQWIKRVNVTTKNNLEQHSGNASYENDCV